jgi:hypothetical protein
MKPWVYELLSFVFCALFVIELWQHGFTALAIGAAAFSRIEALEAKLKRGVP